MVSAINDLMHENQVLSAINYLIHGNQVLSAIVACDLLVATSSNQLTTFHAGGL